jgi:hypothetical protein
VRIPREEFRQTYLDIYARPVNERLVTTIEILSPTNKMTASDGRPVRLSRLRPRIRGTRRIRHLSHQRRGASSGPV